MPALVLIAAPTGAQPRLRSEALAQLKKEGYVLDRRLETAVWSELFDEAITPGLFAERRVFEIDDGKSLGPLPSEYQNRIERSGADTIFLILSEKTLQKELGPAYKLAHIVGYEPAPYWPNQRVGWLQRLAREKGCAMDASAAGLLAEWIEDEEELRAEVDKLARAAEKKRITVQLVNELSVDEGGKAMLNLLDAVARGNVSEALKSLAELRENDELIPLLSAIHKRVRGACMMACLGDKAAQALKLTNFQTRTARAMVSLYGGTLLSAWLAELIRLSWCERTGDGAGWEGLENLTLSVMSRIPRR
jgi:DNA polymerase III delta subunit